MRRVKKYIVKETYKGVPAVFPIGDDTLPVCECSSSYGDPWARARRIAKLLNADFHQRRVTAAKKRQQKNMSVPNLKKAMQEIQEQCTPRKDTRKFYLD